MADIDFPDIGIVMTGSFSEEPASNIHRTEFESGDIKQSRIFQVPRVVQNITMLFTADEYQDFKEWFRYVALDGAKFFDWEDHSDGDEKEFRIVSGLYKTAPLNALATHYTVTFQVEYFPAWDPPEA